MSGRTLWAAWCVAAAAVVGGAVQGRALGGEPRVVIVSLDGFPHYLLADPQASAPTVRKLAAEGATSQGMRVSNPSVTWPNHTSMVTGVRPEKHGVLFNGMLERGGPGGPVRVNGSHDKLEMVRAPTLYDAAKAAGMTTAEVNWPCTRNAPTLDFSFSDAPGSVKAMTPALRDELLKSGLLADDTDDSFRKLGIASRDHIWTEAACHILRQRKPRLMLVHLLTIDATHHRYGPQTPAGYAAVAYVDKCLEKIIATLDETGLRKDTTIFVVSDHGFMKVPKTILPNVALRKAGLLKAPRPNVVSEARVQVIPEGGVGMLYCTNPATREEDLAKAKELLGPLEGIAEILPPERFAEFGLPQQRFNPQMADVVLVGKAGYAFHASHDGDDPVVASASRDFSLGTHGFVHTEPLMKALFVINGPGVKRGGVIEQVENIDIAATAARILGLDMKSIDGRVVEEAFGK